MRKSTRFVSTLFCGVLSAFPGAQARSNALQEANAYQVVKSYFDAWTSKQTDLALTFIADDVQVVGPGSPPMSGSASFKPALERFAALTKAGSAVIHQLIVDGEQVALFYQVELPQPVGVLKVASFFRVENGKIRDYQILFDATEFRKLKNQREGESK